MRSDFAAILGLCVMISTMLATEAHNDEFGEVGNTGSAGHELSWKEANFTIDLELDWFILHEVFLLER